MTELVYQANDNILELDGLKNDATGAFINDATVTVTMVNSSDVEVTGQTWPTTMLYVAASDGIYRATLQDVIVLVEDARYIAKVTANGGAGLLGFFELPVVARIRRDI